MAPPLLRRKVACVGGGAVGKSALVQMFTSHGTKFPKTYAMTVGVELQHKIVQLEADDDAAVQSRANVELFLIDSAGHSIFDEMMPTLHADVAAVVLVYDATRAHTLHECAAKYQAVLDAVRKPRLPGALVANKVDLQERLAVSRDEGRAFADHLGMGYFEVSAKEGGGVEAPFRSVAHERVKAADDDESAPMAA